jgi:hypothetical protein
LLLIAWVGRYMTSTEHNAVHEFCVASDQWIDLREVRWKITLDWRGVLWAKKLLVCLFGR